MKNLVLLLVILLYFGALEGLTLKLKVDKTSIAMGETVVLTVSTSTSLLKALQVFPFVNGYQWGSSCFLNVMRDTCQIILPLPNPNPSTSILVADKTVVGHFLVGTALPANANVSNSVQVNVLKRKIDRPSSKTLFGMEWEPWFTPLNINWAVAEAQPLVGWYDSWNKDVMRMHAIWFAEMGIDFLLIDWTNNIWELDDWSQLHPNAKELINATFATLEAYAEFQAEGLIPVPQLVLLLGLDNGPPANMTVLNQEIEYVFQNWLENPKYAPLNLVLDGKPLIIPFDGGNIHENQTVLIDATHFSIRWMGSQFQYNNLNKQGFWSWMDGTIAPPPTFNNKTNRYEALTITNSFFAAGGWLYPEAQGQKSGTVLMQEFKQALKYRPEYLILCQWNEFAGQVEGQGYGPKHDQYYDIYNVSYSNDMEPTSLSVVGYRSWRGGWGFLYVNLLRALRDLINGLPDVNLLQIGSPEREETVNSSLIPMNWTFIGTKNENTILYSISIDNKVVASDIRGTSYNLTLPGIPQGKYTLLVEAVDVKTKYPISLDVFDYVPLDKPVPLKAFQPIYIK